MATKHENVNRPQHAAEASKTLSAQRAEAIALRLAEALRPDGARSPAIHSSHLSYVSGAICMASALGILSDEHALRLREACARLLEGDTSPSDAREA
jgi:hypothetical protein